MLFFLVTIGHAHVTCNARSREFAKTKAHSWLGGNPDDYTVTPLTEPGDRISLNVAVQV